MNGKGEMAAHMQISFYLILAVSVARESVILQYFSVGLSPPFVFFFIAIVF